MTIGTFWAHVTTLCHVYNGKTISGPRSQQWNLATEGHKLSAHMAGLGADIEFASNDDRDEAAKHAAKMGLTAVQKNVTLHLEPVGYK